MAAAPWGQCIPCDDGCTRCEFGSCLECDAGLYLIASDESPLKSASFSGMCYPDGTTECPLGSFLNATNN